jgi:hypothetical protein
LINHNVFLQVIKNFVKKANITHFDVIFADKAAAEETQKAMETLVHMASNPECTPILVDELSAPGRLSLIFSACEHPDNVGTEKLLGCLLNQLVKVCLLVLANRRSKVNN